MPGQHEIKAPTPSKGLTAEQQEKVFERCPATAEGTIVNTANKYRERGLYVGVVGGLLTGVLPIAVGGLALGGLTGYVKGKREGERLAATGVRQADVACVKEIENIFRNLNKVGTEYDQAKKEADKALAPVRR